MADEHTQTEPTATQEEDAVEQVDRMAVDKRAVMKMEAADAEVRMSAVGYLSAEKAEMRMSPTALTIAKDSADLKLCSTNLLAAGNDVSLQYSGGQLIAAKGDVRLDMAAAGAVLSREVHVDRGLVGLLIAGEVQLGEGSRVLLRPAGAAALGAGFAGGLLLAVAVLWKLFASGLKRRGNGD